ncbi:hypothetical protein A2V71_04695 [Candidatus Berkelbacteria bacterium RBG_13_40_8]|uniref:Fumarate lyase N-terminal domain-containing protein n=1 Tax=Candidatus Berkelbacteria bacterium RBG_13_40_8 TaxID=1797467 RepID=A0A1F5DMP4_9BACT|nr:MAG: hypothetical protein A2V71_04695 [Candidatus Berkelbacteria bacterium RBG_13_40_8]
MVEKNLALPGNPRYQPKELLSFFGYDNLYRTVGEVELANIDILAELGVIPQEEYALLTPDARAVILDIPTTQIDITESNVTKHDIQAWREEARKIADPKLGRWFHLILTSFDALDTGRILQFLRAYQKAVRPSLVEVITILAVIVRRNSDVLQIGRTHGQFALPITVGFWLATVLNRLLYNMGEVDRYAEQLVGKISGAVGAFNAQVGLGITKLCENGPSFEEKVLAKLGLKPTKISTQILPPEPLANFLHSIHLLSAVFGQLGNDCRHLMRSEIAEISEPFSASQSGSSTMAGKRNPINWEGLVGDWQKAKCEYHKVQEGLISEHQRDLVGSRVARDFPILLVILQTQLNTLLKKDKTKKTFLERISINEAACKKNFQVAAPIALAEPLYIALQMAGFKGDAHKFVNHTLTPESLASGKLLVVVLEEMLPEDSELDKIYQNIPLEIRELLHHPENYTGKAAEKAQEIANLAMMIASSDWQERRKLCEE